MGHCHYHCHKTSSSRSRRINLSTLPRSNLNPYPSTRTQGTWFTVTEPSKSTCHKGLSSSIRVLAGKQFWCKVYVGSREAFIAAVHRSNVESWPWNCPTCVCGFAVESHAAVISSQTRNIKSSLPGTRSPLSSVRYITNLRENAEEGTKLIFEGGLDRVEDLDKVFTICPVGRLLLGFLHNDCCRSAESSKVQ